MNTKRGASSSAGSYESRNTFAREWASPSYGLKQYALCCIHQHYVMLPSRLHTYIPSFLKLYADGLLLLLFVDAAAAAAAAEQNT